MPRTRYIKPDFFTDEDVAVLLPMERLFFIGLWCHADRDGRLEYRPQFLKVALAPYDDCDVSVIINRLALGKKPFIKIYEVDRKIYIQIINFIKHQRPHHTESRSKFPDIKKGKELKRRLDDGYYPLGSRYTHYPALYSNGDGDGDGDGNGDGEGEVREVNDIREDKDKTASPALSAAPHFPEEDILRVAEAYCKLRCPAFANNKIYLRGEAMFYPSKELLAHNNGDVDRAVLCLTHFNEHYTDKGKVEWNWRYVLEDFPKWDEGMKAIEAKEIQNVEQTEPAKKSA